MPRQSNGTYLPPANTAAVSGNTISSTAYNSLSGDIGNEITNSLDRGGRSAMTAALPMGGFPINNLGSPTASTDAASKGYVDTAMPSGAILAFAMSTTPSGWLVCDGSAISRTAYAALYTAIGTTYGSGDGSTTFNLPDFRGAFLRGYDNGRGFDSGRTFASYQSDAAGPHTHGATVYDPGHAHNLLVANGTGPSGYYPAAGQPTPAANYGGIVVGSGTGISVGISSNGGTETRTKNYAILYCIKA